MSDQPSWARRVCFGTCLAFGVQVALAQAWAAPAVWRDHASGLALGGVDPLSYFTVGEPRQGDAGLEHDWGGVSWSFTNDGNRAAFARHPEIYAPAFAGYDVYALSRGTAVPGHPIIWAIHGDRVYLFHTDEHLRRWSFDPEGVIARAQERWPQAAANLPITPNR